jgi:hypothetical protein
VRGISQPAALADSIVKSSKAGSGAAIYYECAEKLLFFKLIATVRGSRHLIQENAFLGAKNHDNFSIGG